MVEIRNALNFLLVTTEGLLKRVINETRDIIIPKIFLLAAFVMLSGCYVDSNTNNPRSVRRYWQSYVSQNSTILGMSHKSYDPLPAFRLKSNERVDKEVAIYRFKEARTIVAGFKKRSEVYHLISDIFTAHGLPGELTNIGLVESRFEHDARSSAGAAGMWQFMGPTARSYGLRVSTLRDERNDIILSTVAAARYLRDLYSRFKNWELVLAAYNSGGGRVSKAIKKAQSKNFWLLADQKLLPPETRRFVPKVIAVGLIAKDPVAYGFAVRRKTEQN